MAKVVGLIVIEIGSGIGLGGIGRGFGICVGARFVDDSSVVVST